MYTMLLGVEKMKGENLLLKCIKHPYLYLRIETGILYSYSHYFLKMTNASVLSITSTAVMPTSQIHIWRAPLQKRLLSRKPT